MDPCFPGKAFKVYSINNIAFSNAYDGKANYITYIFLIK